jgi:hypothetical protein
MVKITKLIHFLMVFMHFSIQFWTLTRIRIRNLEFRIRIRQKVPDPYGSGSTTLLWTVSANTDTNCQCRDALLVFPSQVFCTTWLLVQIGINKDTIGYLSGTRFSHCSRPLFFYPRQLQLYTNNRAERCSSEAANRGFSLKILSI